VGAEDEISRREGGTMRILGTKDGGDFTIEIEVANNDLVKARDGLMDLEYAFKGRSDIRSGKSRM
jgi:hypothetical protein